MKVQAKYLSPWADVVAMGPTIVALSTAHQGIDRYGLSCPKSGDSPANLHDLAAKLMTQHQGGNPLLALAQKSIQIRTADPDRSNSDKHFLRLD